MPFWGVRLHVLIWVPLKLVGKGPIYWDLLLTRTVYSKQSEAPMRGYHARRQSHEWGS